MDSLSQMALGAAVGQAVLGHKIGRKAALWGAVCGTLPDLDVLVSYEDVVENFTYHRSASHSIFVHAVATPPLAWLARKIHSSTAQYRGGWHLLIFLALATHPILDCFTAYGTQIFWPLPREPEMWSTLFIIDPLYTLPLLVGLVFVLWKGGQHRRAVRANAVGLGLSCAYLLWSLVGSLHVKQVATDSLAYQRLPYERLFATPTPFNSLLWRVAAVDESGHYEGYYSVFDPEPTIVFERYPSRPDLLVGLEAHWPVQRLQWFSSGFYSVRRRDDQIAIIDLRMGQEPYYVFQFVVGDIIDGQPTPRPSLQIPQAFDQRSFAWIWRRIWEPIPALPEPE